MRKTALLLVLVLLLVIPLSLTGCKKTYTMKVTDENGNPVPGAEVSLQGYGIGFMSATADENGNVVFNDVDAPEGLVMVQVNKPEGLELRDAPSVNGIPLQDEMVLVLKKKAATTPTPTPTVTPTPSPTPSPAATTAAIAAGSVTPTPTIDITEFFLAPDEAYTHYGCNPGTETATLLKKYFDAGQLCLFKNSNGASQAYMRYNLLNQMTAEEWEANFDKIKATLVLPRIPDTIANGQQSSVYVVDMPTWQSNYTSTPPRLPGFPELGYALKPNTEVDEIDITEIIKTAIKLKNWNVDLMVDTPPCTQMQPGEEIVWHYLDSLSKKIGMKCAF